MRQILAIAWKDTLVRFASRSEMLFFLILPIVFSLVISYSTASNGDDRIALLVVDQDGGARASDLLAALAQSKTVRIIQTTAEDADAQFRERKAAAILTIPTGLEQAQASGTSLALGFIEAAGNADAVAARQAVQAALGAVGRIVQAANISVRLAEEQHPFPSDANRAQYLEKAKERAVELFAEQPNWLSVTTPLTPGQQVYSYSSQAQGSAGQLITWVFIPLLSISALFAAERQQGTLRRLVSAPVSRATALLGAITAQLGAALVQMLLLSIFGVLALGLGWWRDPTATLTMFLAFGLASVAFGTMLGTFVRTERQAGAISLALGMSMALLGGCWYPRELFPDVVQKAMLALPTSWAMIGMNDILLRGQGVAGTLMPVGALLFFAVIFFGIGVWRFKYE
jgi:ABC-2 type transport system permease protein